MSQYKIKYLNQAQKFVKKLSPPDKNKVLVKVDRLKVDPTAGKLLGGNYAGCRSLRAWPYRIIYTYDKPKQVVKIILIGHRKNIYQFRDEDEQLSYQSER